GGLADEVIAQMVAVAKRAHAVAIDRKSVPIPPTIRSEAEAQALTVALGLSEGRMTFDDVKASVPSGSPLAQKYQIAYPSALVRAGLDRVDFVDSFPVLTG